VTCRRCLVAGRVQGVWFRSSTQQQARALGLTGSAVNLPDGRVEVIACGDATAVETLSAWLWQGPELAQVSDVECMPWTDPGFDDFFTG
jgi:acylphosphatase